MDIVACPLGNENEGSIMDEMGSSGRPRATSIFIRYPVAPAPTSVVASPAKYTRFFSEKIAHQTGLEIIFEKEAFTSVEARRTQDLQNSSSVDASAAALILQRFLDRENRK